MGSGERGPWRLICVVLGSSSSVFKLPIMEDKSPWNSYGKSCFHILNLSNKRMYQWYALFETRQNRERPFPPPPNNVGMKKRFQDRLKCTGLHKLQHYLGGRGKGEKERHIMLIVLRLLSPIVATFTWQQQWSLYQNKVNSSLAAIQRPAHPADNCKMIY